MADVAAILHTGELYAADRGVRGSLRLSYRFAQRGHAEHAATRGDSAFTILEGRSVKDLAIVAIDIET